MFQALVGAVLQAAAPTPSSSPAPGDYGSSRDFLSRMLDSASPSPGPFSAFAEPAGRLLGVVIFLVLVAAAIGLGGSLVAAAANLRKGSKATGHLVTAFGCALVIVILGSFGVFTLGWFDLVS